MNLRALASLILISITAVNFVSAAELAGIWTAEFESQIGVQKYVYTFASEGGNITGKASYDHSMGKGESSLKDIRIEKDEVSFVETVSLDGMELVIAYSGKISDEQMELKRVVGDFATEQIVAKRSK